MEYSDLADLLCLGGTSQEDKVVRLINAVEQLKVRLRGAGWSGAPGTAHRQLRLPEPGCTHGGRCSR